MNLENKTREYRSPDETILRGNIATVTEYAGPLYTRFQEMVTKWLKSIDFRYRRFEI